MVYQLIDQMLHYKYNYPVTKFDVMVNGSHGYLRVRIDSNQDFHQSIFVQYVHLLLIFVFFLPKKKTFFSERKKRSNGILQAQIIE
jgi:uncharacterized membrane protein affecting hemolysin expression